MGSTVIMYSDIIVGYETNTKNGQREILYTVFVKDQIIEGESSEI